MTSVAAYWLIEQEPVEDINQKNALYHTSGQNTLIMRPLGQNKELERLETVDTRECACREGLPAERYVQIKVVAGRSSQHGSLNPDQQHSTRNVQYELSTSSDLFCGTVLY